MLESMLSMLRKAPRRVPAPLQIRIPADHPHVDELVRIFNILATGGRTQSGLIITGGGVSDEAVRLFLNELEIFLARDGVKLETLIAPFFEQDRPDLSSLMQRVMGATNKTPPLSRTLDIKPRSRS